MKRNGVLNDQIGSESMTKASNHNDNRYKKEETSSSGSVLEMIIFHLRKQLES